MDRYTDLLARLEAAMEGSREIDYEIVRVVFGDTRTHFEFVQSDYHGPYVLCYSSSIDDALTLVPEGFCLDILGQNSESEWIASISPMVDDSPELLFQATKSKPALALCIAALRARQSLEERK